jgi:type II secretory pathway component PulM
MKVAPALAGAMTRLNRLSLRERVMVFGAVITVLFVLWSVALMDPLEARRNDLLAELSALQESIEAAASAAEAQSTTDPVAVAMSRRRLPRS